MSGPRDDSGSIHILDLQKTGPTPLNNSVGQNNWYWRLHDFGSKNSSSRSPSLAATGDRCGYFLNKQLMEVKSAFTFVRSASLLETDSLLCKKKQSEKGQQILCLSPSSFYSCHSHKQGCCSFTRPWKKMSAGRLDSSSSFCAAAFLSTRDTSAGKPFRE